MVVFVFNQIHHHILLFEVSGFVVTYPVETAWQHTWQREFHEAIDSAIVLVRDPQQIGCVLVGRVKTHLHWKYK